jgi:hypothetical protein
MFTGAASKAQSQQLNQVSNKSLIQTHQENQADENTVVQDSNADEKQLQQKKSRKVPRKIVWDENLEIRILSQRAASESDLTDCGLEPKSQRTKKRKSAELIQDLLSKPFALKGDYESCYVMGMKLTYIVENENSDLYEFLRKGYNSIMIVVSSVKKKKRKINGI